MKIVKPVIAMLFIIGLFYTAILVFCVVFLDTQNDYYKLIILETPWWKHILLTAVFWATNFISIQGVVKAAHD